MSELGEWLKAKLNERDLEMARARLSDLSTRRERLALALAAGKMTADIYRNADDQILAQQAAEEKRVAGLVRVAETLPDPEQRRAHLLHLHARFPLLVDLAPGAEVAAALQAVPLRIYCEDTHVVRIEGAL